MDNPYDVLGVSSNSSLNEIKSKYRALAHRYHPDAPEGNQEQFTQIQKAWEAIEKYHSEVAILKKDAWRHSSFFKIYKEV